MTIASAVEGRCGLQRVIRVDVSFRSVSLRTDIHDDRYQASERLLSKPIIFRYCTDTFYTCNAPTSYITCDRLSFSIENFSP